MLAPTRRHAWLAFVLGCLAVVALYYSLPWDADSSRSVIWLVMPIISVLAVACGIALQRPRAIVAWVGVALALFFAGLGDVLWETPERIDLDPVNLPYPSVIDYCYLASYIALFVSILLLVRRRSTGRDRAAQLDASLVATAGALTSWVFLIQPVIEDASLTRSQMLVTISYPVMDVLLLAAAARVWFSVDAGRNRSMRMIVITLVGVLVSDTVYSVQSIHGTWRAGSWWELGWFAFYIGIGAAALHASVATPSVVTTPERAISRSRFILLLALMAILPLLLLLGEAPLASTAQGLVIILGSLVMFGVVLLRLNDLVRQLRETLRRERVLRDANASLAASADITSLRQTTVRAAAELVVGGMAWLIALRRQGSHAVVSCASHGPDGQILRTDSLSFLASLVHDNQRGNGPSALHDLLGMPAQAEFVAQPLTDDQGHQEGYLVVAATPAPPRETGPALAALADAAVLANARVGLGKVLAERASDRRLGRMLQHSTDIIAVLDIDLTIRYLSPGAEQLLGFAPHHVHGASWIDAVLPADQQIARELVQHSQGDRPARGEMRLMAGDGSHRYVDVVASRVVEEEEPGFVLTCHDVTERRALEQQLTHQAFHDSLTGLANRSLFRDRLEHALTRTSRGDAHFAVLFIDLDDFKDVNDSLGHAAGDALLRQVTVRLIDVVREQDTVARLGGDEFAILLESVADDAEVITIAQRIVDSARQPFLIADSHLTTGVSVGVAMARDTEGTAEEIMRNADLALYEAKNLGKSRHATFEPVMHEQAVDRLQLIADLRRAVADDQLIVHFQPIVDMSTGEQVAVEALARWRHPTRGLIGPDQFIPLAEETGLIVPLGRQVLRQALGTVAHWQHDIPGFENLGVSVNLSVRQLLHDDIVEQVSWALRESGVAPSSVVLEITETVLLPDEGVTLERLNDLTSLGVRLYIDDFGTGYSSLSYLQQLPVHGIKLAREFVSTLGCGALADNPNSVLDTAASATGLVSTIHSLAVTLGLSSIVAEGVETPEQRDALLELGYRLGQGFLMARPMSAEAMRTELGDQAALMIAARIS